MLKNPAEPYAYYVKVPEVETFSTSIMEGLDYRDTEYYRRYKDFYLIPVLGYSVNFIAEEFNLYHFNSNEFEYYRNFYNSIKSDPGEAFLIKQDFKFVDNHYEFFEPNTPLHTDEYIKGKEFIITVKNQKEIYLPNFEDCYITIIKNNGELFFPELTLNKCKKVFLAQTIGEPCDLPSLDNCKDIQSWELSDFRTNSDLRLDIKSSFNCNNCIVNKDLIVNIQDPKGFIYIGNCTFDSYKLNLKAFKILLSGNYYGDSDIKIDTKYLQLLGKIGTNLHKINSLRCSTIRIDSFSNKNDIEIDELDIIGDTLYIDSENDSWIKLTINKVKSGQSFWIKPLSEQNYEVHYQNKTVRGEGIMMV